MKKYSSPHIDEIDLIALLKIILDGKIKILFITLISFLIGFGYNSQKEKNYLNSLFIKNDKNTKILRFDYIQKLLKLNQSNQSNQLNQFNVLNQLNQ